MNREQQLHDILGDTLSPQAHSDSQRAEVVESMLRMAARLSKMGAWSIDLPSMKVTWTSAGARPRRKSKGRWPNGCPARWKP